MKCSDPRQAGLNHGCGPPIETCSVVLVPRPRPTSRKLPNYDFWTRCLTKKSVSPDQSRSGVVVLCGVDHVSWQVGVGRVETGVHNCWAHDERNKDRSLPRRRFFDFIACIHLYIPSSGTLTLPFSASVHCLTIKRYF